MAKMIDAKPEYQGEAKVWDKLNEYMPNDMVVYNQREVNGREYDFCLMAENLGILLIEVKGWVSDKINVKGVDNIEVEGYDKPQGSPKKQARAYRFAILNRISEKYNLSPLVLDMVCYPFISKDDYYKSHLDIISEESYTILKEDLEDKAALNDKILKVFSKNQLIPHSEFSYDLMIRIRRNNEPDLVETVSNDKDFPYSRVYVFPSKVREEKVNKIVEDYFGGIKHVIFVEDEETYRLIINKMNEELKNHNVDVKKNNLVVGFECGIKTNEVSANFRIFNFELYLDATIGKSCNDEKLIEEGKLENDDKLILEKLAETTEFNFQQFKVEHAHYDRDVLVEAGAGTGKTFSMVSRIAFLCNKRINAVTNIAEEIAMVTFTNDAAINMKKRLKQMFVNYFVLTGKEKYLKFVEDIDRAYISTIHKFAIGILRGESLYTGLGTNFRISSNEYNRGKAYDIFLGEFLEEMEESNPNFVNELPVPVYDLKKKLMNIADKLFDKSINLGQIKRSEMGVTVDNNLPYFNDLLTKVVFPAEATYLEAMRNDNDIDLKECLIELDKVLNLSKEKLEDIRLKYMFIDEFQDTDDVQIEVFQKLQKLINENCKLFVVGDLKQSIYRFRGAKLNAFEKLQNGKEKDWLHFELTRNYRTDGRLLDLFDAVFSRMGSQKILPYTIDHDRLTSNILSDGVEGELLVEIPCHAKDSEKLLEQVTTILSSEKQKIENLMSKKTLSREERTIAVLVRSNWQVDSIVDYAVNHGVNVEKSTGGDLFQLPSTLDLFKLVLAISNSTNVVHLVNFIESNYTDLKLDYQRLHLLSEQEKLNELVRVLDEFFVKRMELTWTELLNEVYTQPVLFVLKKIFDALQPWEIYSHSNSKKRMYIANYEYLLEKMIQFSRIDALTINQVIEYLSINILTGQQQLSRTMEMDDEGVHIICTTVHKSKGLEYGTVVLPYTSEDISNIKKAKLEANYNDNSLAYTVMFENEIRERNSNFSEDKEVNEQIREEARVLYVALTRTIRNCIWINNIDSNPDISWSTLLEG